MFRKSDAAALALAVALAQTASASTLLSQSIAASGDGGYSVQQKIAAPVGPPGRVRVFPERTVGALQTDCVSLRQAAGAPAACAAPPVEVAFPANRGEGCAGASDGRGFALAETTGIAASDRIDFSSTGTEPVAISDITASTPGDIADASGSSGVMAWYGALPLIESQVGTQASGGGSSSSVMLMGVQ